MSAANLRDALEAAQCELEEAAKFADTVDRDSGRATQSPLAIELWEAYYAAGRALTEHPEANDAALDLAVAALRLYADALSLATMLLNAARDNEHWQPSPLDELTLERLRHALEAGKAILRTIEE